MSSFSVQSLPALLSWETAGYLLFAVFVWLALRVYDAIWVQPQIIRKFLKAQGIDGPEPVPFFGNMFDMRKLQKRRKEDPEFAANSSASPYFAHLVDTYGPVVQVNLTTSNRVILADPALVRAAYVAHNSSFHKPEILRRIFHLLGNGLVTANGELWARQRHLINPAFKHGAIKRTLPTVVTTTREAMATWRALVSPATNGTTDSPQTTPGEATPLPSGSSSGSSSSSAVLVPHVEEQLSALTLDIIGRVAFGADIGGLHRSSRSDADELIGAFSAYFQTFSTPSLLELLPLNNLLPTAKNRTRNRAREVATRAMMRIIAARRQQMAAQAEGQAAAAVEGAANGVSCLPATNGGAANGVSPAGVGAVKSVPAGGQVDLLALMMAATEEGGKEAGMLDQQLMDECITFLVAGHETTSNLLSWAMVTLSQHPEWQERAREEALRVLGPFKGEDSNADEIDFEKLNELKVVGMVLNETLRLYPPAYSVSRTCMETTKLSNKVTIPKGSGVLIPIGVMHRRKELWGEDADKFNPQRFENGTAVFGGAFVPFSIGPRVCIGQSFAMAEAKIILAFLLMNFSWSLAPTYRHHPEIKLTLRPSFGVPVLLQRLD